MSIIHAGTLIPGTHGPVLYEPPAGQTFRTKFAGVIGSSEIRGGGGGRGLFTEIWIHGASTGGFATMAQLLAYLKSLDELATQQAHGTLQITGITARDFPHCTFEGFTPDPLGPLPGTGSEIGFWCKGILRWFQLTTQI